MSNLAAHKITTDLSRVKERLLVHAWRLPAVTGGRLYSMSVIRAEIAFYMAMRSWATLEFYLNTVEDIFFSGRFRI
jgi:hypothetical protein